MSYLYVHALRKEANLIKQHFPQAVSPQCGPGIELRELTPEADLLRIGMGLESARRVLSKIPPARQYEAVVLFGVSGAISQDLKVGQLVHGTSYLSESGPGLTPETLPVPPEWKSTAVRFYSAIEPVFQIQAREGIEARGGQAVDMESYAVAEYCIRNELPLLAVRIISDHADESAPETFKSHFEGVSQHLQRLILKSLLKTKDLS